MERNKTSPVDDPETFTIDRDYFHGQASEAFAAFLAPLSGVLDAMMGEPSKGPFYGDRSSKGK